MADKPNGLIDAIDQILNEEGPLQAKDVIANFRLKGWRVQDWRPKVIDEEEEILSTLTYSYDSHEGFFLPEEE